MAAKTKASQTDGVCCLCGKPLEWAPCVPYCREVTFADGTTDRAHIECDDFEVAWDELVDEGTFSC